MIILETSYTTISFPTFIRDVGSLIGETLEVEAPELLEQFQLVPFKMKVQGIDRTLIDKVFAVCDYYMQGKVKKHSRHIYDIHKLLALVPQDESFKKLVKDVREIRKLSDICISAQDDVDIPTILNAIINNDIYKEDYQALTKRLLGESIDYDVAISSLKIISENGMFE